LEPAAGWSSPVGGTACASGNAVAADNAGHVRVARASISGDFPTAVTTEAAFDGFQPACASCAMTPQLLDAFLAEIAESAAPIPSVYFNFGHVIFSPGIVWILSTPQPERRLGRVRRQFALARRGFKIP
jgi:hypothetical protein